MFWLQVLYFVVLNLHACVSELVSICMNEQINYLN
jgi:hypothetical protein